MPTYTYQCKKCSHSQDVFHSMSAKPRVKCDECGGGCKRLIGSGAGIIFKGSGFYETDYKKNGRTSADTTSESKSESSAKTESKSESKSESSTTEKGKTGGSDSTKAA